MNAHQRRVAQRKTLRGFRIRFTAPTTYVIEGGTPPAEDMLPEGVWDDADGTLWVECCGCHQDRQIEPEQLDDKFDARYFFCGGSPWCIP